MAKETTTTRFKTSRPISDSELMQLMKDSMHPIFAHLEEELLKEDGQVLCIQVTAKSGNIKLEYGVHKL